MAPRPPSFSSFPDLPSFPPPPPVAPPAPEPSSSSRRDRRSRSPDPASSSRRHKDKHRERERSRDRGDRRQRRRREDDERSERRRRDERAGESSSSSHRHRHERKRSRSPRAHGSSSRFEPDTDDLHRPSSSSSRALQALPAEDLPKVNETYYVSTKGDDGNVTYGSLHSYSVAKYRRAGAGNIVGFPPGFKISRDPHGSGAGALVVEWDGRRNKSRTLRYSDKLARSLLDSSSLVIQPSAAKDHASPSMSDYVRLSKRPRLEAPTEPAYRSIEEEGSGSSSGEEDGEEDVALKEGVFGRLAAEHEQEDEDASDVESKQSAYRTRNIQFAQRAKDTPLDVDNWLAWARFSALAGFDERAGASASSLTQIAAGPSLQSRSAITFTILDRAALSHPALERDSKFMLALLTAAAEVEPAPALANRWDAVLAGPLRHDVHIWRAWGNWRMSTRAGQEGEGGDITAWAEEGLQRLRTMCEQAEPGSLESEDIEGVEIYLLLRACFALREAGYVERALAILQAQMELTFYMPPSIARWPWVEQLSSLERFWEAEAPRFGESGSQGWRNSVDASAAPSAPSAPPPPGSGLEDPFSRWLATETLADESILPARTEDEPRKLADDVTDEDDPFKVVLWPDVEPFLVPLHGPTSGLQLIYALFSFLDLPFAPPDAATSTPFFADAFLLNTLAHAPLARAEFFPDHLRSENVPRKLIGEGGMEVEREGGIPSPFNYPIKASPVTTEALVPASSSGSNLLVRHSVDERLKPLIGNVLEQLRKLFPRDPRYALYVISFEASQNIKSAVKRAKSILADNRDSLVLWNAYARLERQRGKVADGRKVYLTALSLSSPDVRRRAAEGEGEVWALWKGWAELEFSESRPGHVVAVIAAAASGDFSLLDKLAATSIPSVSPLQALQVRQFFSQTIDRALDSSAPAALRTNATTLIYLSALFEYLVLGLQAACNVYDAHLSLQYGLLESDKEELHLQYADLLHRHITSPQATFRPSVVRDVLERGIAAFPGNTALLAYFAAAESRMRYQNRVRKVLNDIVLAPASGAKGPNGFLFAIWAELRAVKGRHNEWAVRNLFERAFDRPDANQSLSLWRLAIDHELYLKQPKRAKALLYRAIKACPWAKDLYLLHFGPLRSAYTAKELEELADLMAERRIRVRVPLEPFVQDGTADESDREEEGDAMLEEGYFVGVDERRLIAEQEERRRLMPY